MTAPSSGEVTRLLEALNEGDEDARDQLIHVVYAELRNLASIYMAREAEGNTL